LKQEIIGKLFTEEEAEMYLNLTSAQKKNEEGSGYAVLRTR
jgi:hypothetical protein